MTISLVNTPVSPVAVEREREREREREGTKEMEGTGRILF